MADEKTSNADFIAQVVGDAKNPPETRMLTGWFGDASEEGYKRLYTDAELNSYVDIPDDAILYTEPIRDVQPAGAVLVWIKRDAALKQGGSAFSRAARFLQGQVQQDFAGGGAPQDEDSLRKAGYRCMTQEPCPEPTGFVGVCTKQPDVGGAWPCITAAPQCAAPTGFTGKCTFQPWPNPTQYAGCTIFHCPTHDLTHIPHICNLVASGFPGCATFVPPRGDEEPGADKAKDAEAALPPTQIPGCGYTKQWGLCETQLLGCGFTKEWGHQCPTQLLGCGETKDCPTNIPGCGWSRNPICTDLPGCGFTQAQFVCQPTQPPKCQVSVDNPCITQTEMPPRCGGGGVLFGARAAAPGAVDISVPLCVPTIPGTVCLTQNCETQPVTALCTQFLEACHTKGIEWCPPSQFQTCPTTNPELCPPTTFPKLCPITSCGPKCQTQQIDCPPTKFGPPCATPNLDCTFGCTQLGTGCTNTPLCPQQLTIDFCNTININAQVGAIGPTGFLGCTQVNCPRPTIWTQIGPSCRTFPNGDCTFFGGCVKREQFAAAAPNLTQIGCPVTPATVCTQFGPPCPTQPSGDCTFFGCPSPQCPPTPLTTCTQTGPQCPTQPGGHCTCAGCPTPQCPPTPATTCTQFGPECPTQPNGDCTFFGGCPTPQCPPTPATTCTQFGPECPTQPNGDCTFFGGCPTPKCPPTPATTCTQFGPECPTPATRCFICPPTPAPECTQFGPQCPTQPNGDCTFFNCPTQLCAGAAAAAPGVALPLVTRPWQCIAPTPATRCFICPPITQGWRCPVPSPFCPPFTRTFNCGPGGPSAVDACPTRICGGGGGLR